MTAKLAKKISDSCLKLRVNSYFMPRILVASIKGQRKVKVIRLPKYMGEGESSMEILERKGFKTELEDSGIIVDGIERSWKNATICW